MKAGRPIRVALVAEAVGIDSEPYETGPGRLNRVNAAVPSPQHATGVPETAASDATLESVDACVRRGPLATELACCGGSNA